MDARRVLAEAGREWARPATLGLLGIHLLAVSLLAFAAEEEHEIYWGFVLTAMPLLMAPLAARVVVRDRERGMAALLATTPATRAEAFLAKGVFLASFLLAAVALTVPVTWAVLVNHGPSALVVNAHRFGWALLLGAASAAAGVLVGVLAGHRSTHALTGAFLVVIAWFAMAAAQNSLLRLADTEAEWQAVVFFTHLSPVTWAFHADGTFPGLVVIAADSPSPAWAAALFAPALAAAAGALALRAQHVEGWLRPLPRGAVAGAVAVALLGGGALSWWDFEAEDVRGYDDWSSPDGSFQVDFQGLNRAGGGFGRFRDPVREGDLFNLSIEIESTPGRTFNVTSLHVEADGVTFTPVAPPPYVITAERGPPNGSSVGVAHLRVTLAAHPIYVGGASPLRVSLVVDGHEAEVAGYLFGGPQDVPTALVAATGFAPAAALFAAARLAPRRWNAW